MKKDLSLPLVLYVAEFIYLKVYEIKNKNKDLNNVDAFEIFMGTNEFDEISSGKFHDNWFKKLKEKNSMVKELIKITKLYYAKSHYPLELSQRAFNHLWRVCESYELWCKETKQDKLILLGLAS